MKNQKRSDTKRLSLLGNAKTNYEYGEPNKNILETFDNVHPDSSYIVPFECTEFTSLCPKTGQPDFAELHIIYVPDKVMVESKSLKLYLFSFRQHGEFHEDVINCMVKDFREVLSPKYVLIIGNFKVRGGIAIKPIVEWVDKKVKKEELKSIRWKVEQYWKVLK